MKARIFTLEGVAIVMFALAVATSVVSALTTITRDVGGSVTAVVNDPDGIEVYLDENLTQVADSVAFCSIKIDLFGTVKEGGAVPVWVHNLSLSTVRLSVEDDFTRADVAFDGDGSTLDVGQTLAGELSLNFSSGAQGDFDFTITFNADGPIISSVISSPHDSRREQ